MTSSNNNNNNGISVLGMGNPLLDISNTVSDEFFNKYGLKPDNAILAEEKHLPIYEEMSNMDGTEYIAGGSTLNTIRVAQWMSQSTGFSGYMGCIGRSDKFGKLLLECASNDGVQCNFDYSDKNDTGLCAVTINNDKERSLTTNLLAANDFSVKHMSLETSKQQLSEASVVYTAGFFITVSPESMEIAGKHCLENNKWFGINFSADFIVSIFKDPFNKIFEYANLVFTNEGEAVAFAKANEIKYNDMTDLCNLISKRKCVRKEGRTVVITQGSKSVLVSTNGECVEYKVTPLPKDKIVDLNGAGDAFVGGFISQLANNKTIGQCVAAGNYAASYIIQTSGTKLSGSAKQHQFLPQRHGITWNSRCQRARWP